MTVLIPLMRRLKAVPDSYVPETRKIVESLGETKNIIVCCPLVSLMNDQVTKLKVIKYLVCCLQRCIYIFITPVTYVT